VAAVGHDEEKLVEFLKAELHVSGWTLVGYFFDVDSPSSSRTLSEHEASAAIRPVGRLLTWVAAVAAKALPESYSARYLADLLSELTETPGHLTRLGCAVRQVIRTPATSAAFRSAARQVREES
jgi:hypothetical protein